MKGSAKGKHLRDFAWPVLLGVLGAAIFLLWQGKAILPAKDTAAVPASTASVAGFSSAVAKALPSVVNVYTVRVVAANRNPRFDSRDPRRFFDNFLRRPENRLVRGLGSGVIVSQDGFILTNHHVIDQADQIGVMLHDGQLHKARLIGTDEATDIAVLKVELANLVPIEFADAEDVHIGDIVLAIGNPYGIGQTVTQGIVSALGRYGIRLNTYESYIQTDAAINAGNSGGALVNTAGQLVGINSALYTKTGNFHGIGFAIPNDISTHVLEQLVRNGEVVRGWLGARFDELTPLDAEYFGFKIQRGLLISQVVRGGPADSAGLKPGDVITHIDGEEMGSRNASVNRIAHSEPGTMVNFSIYRAGITQSVLVKLGRQPTDRSV